MELIRAVDETDQDADIAAILADPDEPFETADDLIAATYEAFSVEMLAEPLMELWNEAAEFVRGANHDDAYTALDAIEGLCEQTRERLRSVEQGTAWADDAARKKGKAKQ